MRIAILHPGMNIKGGAENVAAWLGHGLRERGHQPVLITDVLDRSNWSRELIGALEVQLLPRPPLSSLINSNAVRLWERSRQLAGPLKHFDVVIAQRFPYHCWAAKARADHGGDYRIVWLCQEPLRRLYPEVTDRHMIHWRSFTPAGVENEHLDRATRARLRRTRRQTRRDAQNRRWDAEAAAQCDIIVTNSAFTAQNVRDIFHVNPAVCHLGVPLPPPQMFDHGHYVAVLTSLAERKNVPNAIRAIALLRERGRTDIRMKIAGRGPDRAALEELARTLGVSELIEFLGGIADEALPGFYAHARMLVYCPVDEPFGLVPLEAAAVNTPVIVSDHGGPAETILDQVTGLHANPFDPASIAGAIERLWDDEALCRRLADAGNRRAREYFSLDAFLDRFDPLLAKTTARLAG